MTSPSFNKIITTESTGSSSPPSNDFVPELQIPTTVPMDSIEMTSCNNSNETSTTRRGKPNNISRPTSPTPATPVIRDETMNTPMKIKKVLSLDLEMRSRKRRRDDVCEEEDCFEYHSSPTSSLRLPNLIPLEDCDDSHFTCLPDTSFLRQKKPSLLRRQRRRIV